MKRFILIVLAGVMLTSSACLNRITKGDAASEAASENILADRNGFRGIKWLTGVEDIPGLELVDQSQPIRIYRRHLETVILDGEKLPPIQYGFYANRFCAAAVLYALPETGRRLIRILEKTHGPATQTGPADNGGTVYIWDRSLVEITLVVGGRNLLQYRYKPVFNSLEEGPAR